MSCDCAFDADPDDPEEGTPEKSWHYLRTCLHCGHAWFGLHCPHDGRQNPCPHCRVIPQPVPAVATDEWPLPWDSQAPR